MKSLNSPNYRLTGRIDDPTELDYNIFGFNKLKTFSKGELTEVKLVDDNNNVVVIEKRIYTRGAFDMLQTRTLEIDWYLEDGEIGCSQVSKIKTYTPEEALVEGEIRRKNVITESKFKLMSLVNVPYAIYFLRKVKLQMDLYVEGDTTALISSINNATESFMTEAVKATIVSTLTL